MLLACDQAAELTPALPYEPSTKEITFRTADHWQDDQMATKGVAFDQFREHDCFGLFAYYLPDGQWQDGVGKMPDFMHDQPVRMTLFDDTPIWEYTPVKYWPNSTLAKVKFYAYYPHRSQAAKNSLFVSANDVAGAPTITFIPHELTRFQSDFMTAAPILADKTMPVVTPHFTHQLTQVVFSARHNGPADYVVVITDIEIKGVKVPTYGTFCEPTAANNMQHFEWSDTYRPDPKTIHLTSKDRAELLPNTTEGQAELPSSQQVLPADEKYKMICSPYGTSFLSPQHVEEHELKLTVYFELMVSGLDRPRVISLDVHTPAHEYQIGKRVHYHFTLDVLSLVSIDLDDVVYENWVDAGVIAGETIE